MAENRTPLPNKQITCWKNVIADSIARFGRILHGVKTIGKGHQRKEYQYVVFNVGEDIIECTWNDDDNHIRLAVMHGIDAKPRKPNDADILAYVIQLLHERFLLSLPDTIDDTRTISSCPGEQNYTATISFYRLEGTPPSDEERLDQEFHTVDDEDTFTRRMLMEQGIYRDNAIAVSNRFMNDIAGQAAKALTEKRRKGKPCSPQEELLKAYKKPFADTLSPLSSAG